MIDDRYVCVGNVRGHCGHIHRSIETAETCCLNDQKKCIGPIGSLTRSYSDRIVYRTIDLPSRDIWMAGRKTSKKEYYIPSYPVKSTVYE
jgi:hypothetical protein